ncbi:hypothetical protein [Zhenpiania hominis]|uniref:SWIM-type domain-containing protein n=1 Tax=Zhenpiania hominis TaxID=2763644 RepID=A0A923SQR6_9FIRM|nr:hypothetical protein [Zhenpiania hominis]MBC6679917.1 hypothetical protein [Zhenpiania hominis]
MNFYISKFRYKLAFAFLAGIVIMIVNGLIMGMPFLAIFKQYGIVFLVLAAMGVYLWYPAFKYRRTDSKTLWQRWGYLGRKKERKEFEDFHFQYVHKKTRYAMTKEPDKGYRTMTTLEGCNCVEFRKNHAPCVHMCKLADILGLYETSEQKATNNDEEKSEKEEKVCYQ